MPTEDQEQIAFVQWLDLKGIPYWHTNNEMWTKSWKQKTRSKAMGTQSGIPDLFLVFKGRILGIEMKRQKGGIVSDSQKYWHQILALGGIETYVCHGCDEAIKLVESLCNPAQGYVCIPTNEIAAIRKELDDKETERQLKRLKNSEKIEKSAKKRKKPVEF